MVVVVEAVVEVVVVDKNHNLSATQIRTTSSTTLPRQEEAARDILFLGHVSTSHFVVATEHPAETEWNDGSMQCRDEQSLVVSWK